MNWIKRLFQRDGPSKSGVKIESEKGTLVHTQKARSVVESGEYQAAVAVLKPEAFARWKSMGGGDRYEFIRIVEGAIPASPEYHMHYGRMLGQ